MSVDIIGWETMKRIDLMQRLDYMLAGQETVENSAEQIKILLEAMDDGFSKEMISKSVDIFLDFMKFQREQIIWIKALKDGMMEIESRLDNVEGA